MRTAVANEDSVVEDGQPIALPYAPPLSTRNMVLATGSAVQVNASGSDTLKWPQQATPQGTSVVVPAGSSLTFFYTQGTWYIIAEGAVPAGDTVVSYNGRVGAVTSQLTDVTRLFTGAGQLIAGTAGSGDLLNPGATGTVLTVGGSDSSGLEWTNPITIGAIAGPPVSGTWLKGQGFFDTNDVLWVCEVGGTPGTWAQVLQNPTSEAWTSYTPTWTATINQPSLTGATFIGKYFLIGKLCAVHIMLNLVGWSGTGGSGTYYFSLPFTSISLTNDEQELFVKFYNPYQGFNMTGFAYIPSGTSYCIPALPINSSTSNMNGACNETTSGGGVTTSVPRDGVNFPFGLSTNLVISGVYQIA